MPKLKYDYNKNSQFESSYYIKHHYMYIDKAPLLNYLIQTIQLDSRLLCKIIVAYVHPL